MPRVLILDEPTSALTEAEIDKLMEILRTLKEHGVTCIYITHKIEEFFRIGDTITVLRDGKVVITQPAQGLERGKTGQLYGRARDERTLPEGES